MTKPATSSRCGPLTPLVDLFVFAPIGLVVMAKEHLPRIVEMGRRQADTQIRVARMVGEFAVTLGRRELAKRFAGNGLEATEEPSRPVPASPVPEAVNEAPRRPTTLVSVPRPASSDEDLAIPGYDSLAASQVVERLASLSPEELEAIRRHEEGGRRRRTVLHRIEQLAG